MKRIILYISVLVIGCGTLSFVQARKKTSLEKKTVKKSANYDKQAVDYSHEISFAGADAFNPEKKREEVVTLVKKGVSALERYSLIDFLRMTRYTNEFEMGDLFLSVYDDKGTCVVQGKQMESLWENCLEERDVFGTFFVKRIIDVARNGGGWISYQISEATRLVYAQMVKKDGRTFIVSCGYFPQTKQDAVVAMVKGAVSTFYKIIENGGKVEDAFSQFSYPGGKFVSGELYIYVIDKNAVIKANGFDPSEIGVNYWDEKDPQGVYYLRQVVQKMNRSGRGSGEWFEFEYYNAPERDYAERVVDGHGNSYYILCGYNPLAGKDKAVELTQRAKKAVQEQGLEKITAAINDLSNQEFVYGRMTVFMYASDGTVVANGERPALVGKNSLHERDETGSFYVKELIETVTKDPETWVSYLFKRAVVSVYAEQLELNGKMYVVGASYFPVSKESLTVLLVKSAKMYLASVEKEKALRAFNDVRGNFVVGDLSIFVYAQDGTCYADGSQPRNTWKNRLKEQDDNGHTYIKTLIDQGIVAPVKVGATKNGVRMVSYVEPVIKDNASFIVGSSYFL